MDDIDSDIQTFTDKLYGHFKIGQVRRNMNND